MSERENVILRAENLAIGYVKKSGNKTVQKNIHAELFRGELACMIGPNGVGKSTLLRTLSGVQRPLAGSVFLNGVDLYTYDSQKLAKEVSLTLTDKSAGNMSVFELIALGRYPHTDWTGRLKQEDDEKINTAIAAVHCESILQQKVYELSDGQIQKAMIARALAQDGDLMIMDEPSAHLDLNNKIEILILLQKLAAEHRKAILIATHELDLALQVADRLWLVSFDQPLVTGIPEQLVLAGALSGIFKSESYSFDLMSGKIKILRSGGREVSLEGSGREYFWTLHALERNGIVVGQNSDIRIIMKDGKWLLTMSTGTQEFDSMEDLLNQIRRLPLIRD